VTIPEQINSRWVAQLANDQLIEVEGVLHARFREHEIAEKRRKGARYVLLQGPAGLVTAWHRWLLASNETRTRGLAVNHQR